MQVFFLTAIVLLLSICRTATAAPDCKEPGALRIAPGMQVIVPLAGPNWQAATIDSIRRSEVMVTSADGGKGSIAPKEIVPAPGATPACFKPGDKVLAQADKEIWREAKIVTVTETGAEVIFQDKKKQTRAFSEIVRFPK